MKSLTHLTEKYPELEVCKSEIQQAFAILHACFQAGGKLLVCGNGGSAADSEHIVGELMKGYLLKRKLPAVERQKILTNNPENGTYLADHLQGALPAISLVSQSVLISAFANDIAPEMVYAQQVYGYGRPGDVLLGISTSGNAQNVLHAFQVARSLEISTIGLTGPGGGMLMALSNCCICVPGEDTTAIQERHLPVYHTLCAMLETAFFTEG